MLLVFGIFFIFLNVSFISAACTNSTYSGTGNWIINSTNSNNTCSDMEITMNGNLTIQSGGNLTFNNVTLRVNNSVARANNISVFSEGYFYIYDSNISALSRTYTLYVYGTLNADNLSISGNSDVDGMMLVKAEESSSISINNSFIGSGIEYYPAYFYYSSSVFIENTTFNGSYYGVGFRSVTNLVLKNCTWNLKTYINNVHLRCIDCYFGNSIKSYSSYSIYSKNHRRINNQTFVWGNFNYLSSLSSEYKTESNSTIVFQESDATATIDSGVNVTFENVSVISSSVFSNTNSFTVNGNLIINQTNSTILDVDLINRENVVTDNTYLFQKFYLDVKAQWQGEAVADVDVWAYDIFNNLMFNETSAANGYITSQNLTEFHINDSGITGFNNYTINSSEIDGESRSEILNLTISTFVTLPHDYCDFLTTGDWDINDENKTCENRAITILEGGITVREGFKLSLYNCTLNFTSGSPDTLTVESNATLIFNKSVFVSAGAYATKYVSASEDSKISYIDSSFDKYIRHTIYVKADYVNIQNSSLGGLKGGDNTQYMYWCAVTFKVPDTSPQEIIINRSLFLNNICLDSDVSGGNFNITLLDSDYIPYFQFASNAVSSKVFVNNTLDLKVLDDDLNAVSSKAVNVTDENRNSVYNGTTDANGEINGISLIHRIINSTSDIIKNYTLTANGKSFDLIMGMPRRNYSNRQVYVGTYNQNYEEKLSRVPYLYDFGYTIHDDTDTYDYTNGNEIYLEYYDLGFLTSISTWAWDVGGAWNKVGFVDNETQREWLLDLQSKGFELALHSATASSDIRNNTLAAFNNWSLYFGFPMMYIEHGTSNIEHLVTGSGAVSGSSVYLLDLVNTSNVSYYWNFDCYANENYRTTRENSSTFYNGWKAYEESIDPITGERWSNGEVSLFPNYTNPQALLCNTTNTGTAINLTSMIGKIHIRDRAHTVTHGIRPLYSPTHIFELQETHDLTMMYTHSKNITLFTNHTLTEIARYDGYFVPAGVLLDYSKKLERVAIVGGDKTFTVTNNGEEEIEGVVVYPDTNGTIINISYANTTAGNYLLSIGLDKDEMMLPSLASGESLTVTYDIMGTYNSSIPKIIEITNSNVELRNAIYNSTAKKTEFKVGLDRITTYNSTNSTPRSTNITIENLDASKTYTILRDDSAWTNHSWDSDNTTLYVWTFLSTHNFTIQEEQSDGASCSYAASCLGGYCVHNICRSASIYCGDNYCDTGETCSSCSTDCGVCSTSSGGISTYNPSSEQLEEGYSKLLRETQKVKFTINNQNYTAVINSVNVINKKVEVEIEGEGILVELSEGSVGKIDLNDDGYYDLQISCKEVRINGYADLEFKEIHEEIPVGEKEEQESPSKVEEIKIKNWMWISGGIIVLVFIGFVIKQLSKKKIN